MPNHLFKYLTCLTNIIYGCIIALEENQIGQTRRLHDPSRHHSHLRRRGSHTAGSGRRALPPESGAGRNRLPEVLHRLTQPPHARDNPSQQYRPIHPHTKLWCGGSPGGVFFINGALPVKILEKLTSLYLWSGIRESNSRLLLGKQSYCHCTNPADLKLFLHYPVAATPGETGD